VRGKVQFHRFLVGFNCYFVGILQRLTQDLFLLLRGHLNFGFWTQLFVFGVSFYWFQEPSVAGVFSLFVKVYI